MYEILLWELVHSSMFIFDQFLVWYKTAWDLYVIYICPFVFGRVINQEVKELQIMFPVIILTHMQYWIVCTFDLHHDSLDFVAIFKSNKPNTNGMENIHRK